MGSDSDEPAAAARLRELLLQMAGAGDKRNDDADDGSDGSECSIDLRRARATREPPIVLKLKAAEDGQLQSRLSGSHKRPQSSRAAADDSTLDVDDAIAQIMNTVKAVQQGGAGGARGDLHDDTASVSREKYLKLKEQYNRLDERHAKLLDKYYWLEKEALILMKLVMNKGEAPPAAAPAPASAPSSAAVTRKDGRMNRAEEEAPSSPARSRGRPRGPGGDSTVRLAGGTGVHVTRAQWAALQAAASSRALVRLLAVALFGQRALTGHEELEPGRMAVLRDELRRRLEAGGWPEPAARRVTPATARRYVQNYRAQLRYKEANTKGSTPGPSPTRLTCRECKKRFQTRSRLAAHARTHSGEQPYRCSECGARFKYHAQFNQHAREHRASGARARACPRCGAAFAQLAHLHWHTRHAHGGAAPAPAARAYKPVKPHPVWECVPLRDADDADA